MICIGIRKLVLYESLRSNTSGINPACAAHSVLPVGNQIDVRHDLHVVILLYQTHLRPSHGEGSGYLPCLACKLNLERKPKGPRLSGKSIFQLPALP